ncbi:HNH endonuclease [Burkholderia gladioli]|uniref:HNH endonuclease n=1 Tax=Burkholderia gladioli TaxID=28095 RepID=UPI0016410097|nr:HNH endonuclease [Burkholderia gladioli]MBU9172469.1 HNH endonuclease [Burkholderia gladioli]MBU9385528.1 HNH endonuclease [Burkholderia gladioli]MDN7807184.1 HNH endonuclease [Burkholderia gladioli]
MMSLAKTDVEKGTLRRLLRYVANDTLTGTGAWTCFSSPRAKHVYDEDQPPITFTADEIKGLKSLKKRVVEKLELKHHRACAYCRRPVGHYGYGWHIEHVYPKADFPQRTFSLPNLTIGCVDCNQWKAARVDRTTLAQGLTIIEPVANGFRYGNHINLVHIATEDVCLVKYRPVSEAGRQTYAKLQFADIERSTIIDSVNDDLAALHRRMNDLLAKAQSDDSQSELVELLGKLKSKIYRLG